MKCYFVLFFYLRYASARLDTTWWKHTSIYELIIFAFKDTDGDGIGDIKGITSNLHHFNDLGIETLYVSHFYEKSTLNKNYDISNHKAIDPLIGSMGDFEELIKEMKIKGMKLITDFIINYTSDENDWFLKSIDKIDPYTNYYIWKNPSQYSNGVPKPPDQWESFFGESAWKWNEKRKQFYHCGFEKKQPDLNLRNETLKKEILSILEFWLDKGVNGFKLYEPRFHYNEDEIDSSLNIKEETLKFMHEIRTFLDAYNQRHAGFERILSLEINFSPQESVFFYGTKYYSASHTLFNYYIGEKHREFLAYQMEHEIQKWLGYLPKGETTIWMSQNREFGRIGSVSRSEFSDINTIVTATLPGVVLYYYGVEIGLLNGYLTENQILRGNHKNDKRLIMQWDDSINSGFSKNLKTYLPSAVDYSTKNVKMEKNAEISHYKLIQNLNRIRKTKTLKQGKYFSIVYSIYVHIFWRSLPGHETYITITNLNDTESEVDLISIFRKIPSTIIVEAASVNSEYKKGQTIAVNNKQKINMKPLSAIVFNSRVHL